MECPICHTPTQDGLWCPGCSGDWQGWLSNIAIWWPELHTAETKQVHFRMLGRSRPDPYAMPANLHAADVARHAMDTISTWSQRITGRHGTMTDMTRWLSDQLDDARRHPNNLACWTAIRDTKNSIMWAIDRPPDSEYLGDCPSKKCANLHLALTCKPGAHTATCRNCGTEYDADQTRENRRKWSDDQLVTQAQLTKAGFKKTSVSWWIRSGALPCHGTINGKPAYNLGDARTLRERAEKLKNTRHAGKRKRRHA